MTVFSTDSDILRYEPSLFGDLHLRWQNLSQADDGQVTGTVFSSATGDFISNAVQSGGVIYIKSSDGLLEGMYEICSVDSETELTISAIRQGSEDAPIAVGQGSGLFYRISTFAPQSYEVMFELTQYFGIGPGNPESNYGVDDICEKDVLRQASTYAVIAGVYATLGSNAEEQDHLWSKSLHYQKLFEKARERCRLSIDFDKDGNADRTNIGGSVRLVRD
jgi:hypothetical protein